MHQGGAVPFLRSVDKRAHYSPNVATVVQTPPGPRSKGEPRAASQLGQVTNDLSTRPRDNGRGPRHDARRDRGPGVVEKRAGWASLESNRGPQSYQDCALTD